MNASAKSSSVATARTYPTGDAADWICRYTPEIESMEELRHVENAVMTFAIVGYRTPEDIVECAERCRSQAAALGGPVEVLVVDNTGLEPVIDRLRQKVDRLVRLKRNVGLCPARNLAAALARTELVAFVDDDGWLEPGWGHAAREVLQVSEVLAVRGRIVFKNHPWYSATPKHYDLGRRPVDDLLSTEGNCVVRREEFIAAGGFAHELMGGEGLDLVWRWRKLYPGRVVRYEPSMVMRHDYYNSWDKMRAKTLRYVQNSVVRAGEESEIDRYNREFLARRNVGLPSLSIDQWVARYLLRLAQEWIRLTARKQR